MIAGGYVLRPRRPSALTPACAYRESLFAGASFTSTLRGGATRRQPSRIPIAVPAISVDRRSADAVSIARPSRASHGQRLRRTSNAAGPPAWRRRCGGGRRRRELVAAFDRSARSTPAPAPPGPPRAATTGPPAPRHRAGKPAFDRRAGRTPLRVRVFPGRRTHVPPSRGGPAG